ncbi:unnamed protein product [Vitrella brassicaformis CCMP3155]|uniref:NADP-dependent oxidoreductase domain-containing protein n=1 Tax=Vitrella brassicaformis (strain CCMP3155) TaxID=1169540 RepID=A0A0G4GHK2_VITBC|nr:unnamed protein product [Vitrella brassicaformis CCMP3155]|eukprot:CEM29212.1 unnamed protein product [Vitrella brassicaformis CCMP3155]
MPCVGFGTYTLKKGQVKKPLEAAFAAGYRMLDTAWVYDNEKEIGEVLRKASIPREDLFIETKVWRSYHGFDKTLECARQSIRRLGVDYVDLIIIHWPGPGRHMFKQYDIPADFTAQTRLDTWRALEQLYSDGTAKAIGVSNFSIAHLKHIMQHATVKPMVNQIELHPLLVQDELVDFCRESGIIVQAYSSLGAGAKDGTHTLLGHPTVTSIASAHGKSASQVLLRYGLQKGDAVLPRSSNTAHIAANIQLFDEGFVLTDEQMQELDGLNVNKRFAWKGVDPATIE